MKMNFYREYHRFQVILIGISYRFWKRGYPLWFTEEYRRDWLVIRQRRERLYSPEKEWCTQGRRLIWLFFLENPAKIFANIDDRKVLVFIYITEHIHTIIERINIIPNTQIWGKLVYILILFQACLILYFIFFLFYFTLGHPIGASGIPVGTRFSNRKV